MIIGGKCKFGCEPSSNSIDISSQRYKELEKRKYLLKLKRGNFEDGRREKNERQARGRGRVLNSVD